MNDFFKKLLDQAKALWAKWTPIQKLILAGVVLAAVIARVDAWRAGVADHRSARGAARPRRLRVHAGGAGRVVAMPSA